MTQGAIGPRVKVRSAWPVFISWPVIIAVDIGVVLRLRVRLRVSCGSNHRLEISDLPIQRHKDSYSKHRAD